MITEDGRGFLIDWDLAKSIDVIEPRTSGRTVSRVRCTTWLDSDFGRIRELGNSFQPDY
jgi:hypothetical protein